MRAHDWDALVSGDASPFVEHAWLSALEEAGCVSERAGWLPRHLVLFEGDTLVAALPTYEKTNSEGEFVFDWSWADVAARIGVDYYPKLVSSVPFTPASGHRTLVRAGVDRAAVVSVFAKALRQIVEDAGVSSAHVLFPEADEAALWASRGFLPRHGVQYHWTNEGFATFEDFLKTMPTKKRTQVRRERKQPAMDGVTIETLRPEEITEGVVDAMYELYLTTVDKYVYGRRYLNRRFFHLVADRFRSRLAWVVAWRGPDIVASAFNVKKGKTLYGRYWGTRVDLPYLHFNVCFYHGIDECIREGLSRFNPGAGGEHKRVRGFRPTTTYSAHWIEDRRLRAILEPHLERERAAVDAYVASGGEE